MWREPGLPGVDLFKASFKRFAYGRHFHGTYALGLIEAGTQAFRHSGVRHLAPAGTVIAVNPGEAHDGEAASAQGYAYRMLYFDPVSLWPEDAIASSSWLRGPAIDDPYLARTFAQLLRRVDGQDVRADERISLELQARLLAFWRLLLARHGGRAEEVGLRDDARVRRARDYLASDPSRDFQLAEVAAVAGLSRFHFLRCFADAYGLTPHAFLMSVRLDAVRKLLAAGEPVAQAAAATGFADQAHLTRRFKAAYGLTPGRFVAGLTATSFKTSASAVR